MLEAKNITKSYEDLQVLKGVNLSISGSTITSIIGKSGSGKSTLLHILGTLDVPDTGSVFLNDIEINKLNEKELSQFRNKEIGFVFQFHHLIPEFSALENVSMPALINGISKHKAHKKSSDLLSYLGLSGRLDHKPNELSGGEQQRVAIARALINDPKIIFADEPTGNLDTQNSVELHELFMKLRDDMGQTFVIVTHNMELAQLSDRVLEIVDGNITNS